MRDLTFDEIESVSGGDTQTGASNVANGVALVGALIVAVAVTPAAVITTAAVVGASLVALGAGYLIGQGSAQIYMGDGTPVNINNAYLDHGDS